MALKTIDIEALEYAAGARILIASSVNITGPGHSDVFAGGADDGSFEEVNRMYASGYCTRISGTGTPSIGLTWRHSDSAIFTGDEDVLGTGFFSAKGSIPVHTLLNPKRYIRAEWFIDDGTDVKAYMRSLFVSLEFMMPSVIGHSPGDKLQLDADKNPAWVTP